MRPTKQERRFMDKRSARRVGTVLVALTLVAGACGTSDTSDQVARSPVSDLAPGEAQNSTSDDAGVSPVEWGEQVIAAWGAYDTARSGLATTYIEALITGEPEVDLATGLFEGEGNALAVLAAALPPEPADAKLIAAFGPFVAAIEADQRTVEDGLAQLLADGDALQAEFDQLNGDPEGESAYIGIRIARNETDAALAAACFDLQTVVADVGAGILDCAQSDESDAPPSGDAQGDIDPTTTPTGFVSMPSLEAGTYPFPVFERTLTLTFADAVTVGTVEDAIEVSLGEDDVYFVVTETLADPAALAPECCVSTIPIPDDLLPWINELPVTVVDEGVWRVAGVESVWADIEFDFEADYDGDPVVGLVAFGEAFGIVLFPDSTLRLSRVEHPDGPLLVAVLAVDLPMSELGLVAEEIVSAASFGG